MDMFVNDVSGINAGTMRSARQEQINQAVGEYNGRLATSLKSLQEQTQTAQTERGIQDAIQGFVGQHRFSQHIQSFRELQQKGKTFAQSVQGIKSGGQPENVSVEGGNAERSSGNTENAPETTEGVATPEGSHPSGTVSETVEEASSSGGGRLAKGFKAMGMSEETAGKVAESVGKGAGAVTGVAEAGLGIYEDIKAGKVAGDNGWEKASNIIEIGGGVLDTAGAFTGGLTAVLGAGLDVLEYEKASFENLFSSEMPQAFEYLIQAENVLLTPHVAGWTIESKEKLAQTIVDKIKQRFC